MVDPARQLGHFAQQGGLIVQRGGPGGNGLFMVGANRRGDFGRAARSQPAGLLGPLDPANDQPRPFGDLQAPGDGGRVGSGRTAGRGWRAGSGRRGGEGGRT